MDQALEKSYPAKIGLEFCPYDYSPLECTNIFSKCSACYEDHHDNKQGYKCDSCEFYVHQKCINVNIPSRHKHPLELIIYLQQSCSICCLCETTLNSEKIIYYCSQCSFIICVSCARKPLIFSQTKAHEHELHQLLIKLPFTCDACGLCTTNCPVFCLQCCFIIHRVCIFLPRVIYINRHHHRISHVFPLGPGKWICGICHEHVNGECGAYSCSVCLYVAHSKCATSFRVWDKKELEGVPEDEKEETQPFEVIDQNLIKHFSHEHNLMKVSISSTRLEEDALPRGEDKHCYACTLPLYSELGYECIQCDFVLHDVCANFPSKKWHLACTRKLTLCAKGEHGGYFRNYFVCDVCRRYCTGFMYTDNKYFKMDVRCASISDTYKHESHPHMLFVFLDEGNSVKCEGCHLVCRYYLSCHNKDDCSGFKLCFTCATLPLLVRHKYDDHPLSLYYGENSMYCCVICEEEIYIKGWFYKCNDCCSTFHMKCVFTNLIHPRRGYSLKKAFDLLPNNHLSRPICYACESRCMGDLVLNDKTDTKKFLCCSCGFPEICREEL